MIYLLLNILSLEREWTQEGLILRECLGNTEQRGGGRFAVFQASILIFFIS